MKFTDNSLQEIKHYFPDLKVVDEEILGEIAFTAKYVQNKRGKWMIESCNLPSDPECVSGKYQISITANQTGVFKVFETKGEIAGLAKQFNKPFSDLHINNDGSCCLDFYLAIHPKLEIGKFILSKVYPFFVWQAYYEKFHSVPPIGEYPHDLIMARREFINNVKQITRNDICFCGSGKKFKRCCMNV